MGEKGEFVENEDTLPPEVIKALVRLARAAKSEDEAVELLTLAETQFVRAAAPYHQTLVGMAKSREAQAMVFGGIKSHLAWVSGTVALLFTLRDQIGAVLMGVLK